MKIKKYFGFATLVVLFACNNEANKTTDLKDSKQVADTLATSGGLSFNNPKQQSIYTAYISLKNNLVNSKFKEAKLTAKALSEELKGFNGCESTAATAVKIENAKDIAAQRKDFTGLNSDLIALFKHADLKKGSIYIQHCPMANNGDGGDWLSSEKKIQNPYYGSEMMECGAVVEEIKSK